jgi:hypothetical protein
MGLAVGIATLVAVLLSRVLLLPDGPWEQDEALFAAGVLDFDITRHRPHPPGFPGWIALGKLLLPLAGDPVLALQLASSVASVVLLWAMAQLLDRITPGGRATALALGFTMSPLAWAHAGRGFSTTPAVACAALAIVVWLNGRQRLGWVLLAITATIRPQLLPELAVLGAFALTRGRRSHALQGLGVAVALGGLCVAVLASTSGGWEPMQQAFADHLGRHRGGMGRTLSFESLGFVRGLGHPAVAAAVLVLAAVGIARALRADRPHGLWLLALVGTTGWMMLRHHHPGFPRYTVVLLAVLMPCLAWAEDAVRSRYLTRALWVAAVVSAAAGTGPVLAMRGRALPAVAAARLVTEDPRTAAFLYSHGLFSFARLQGQTTRVPLHDQTHTHIFPTLPPHTYALAGSTVRFVEGVTTCTLDLPPAPPRAMRLGQARFGHARLGRDAVLLGTGVHAPEPDANGEHYAWLSNINTLFAPAGTHALQLRLDVPDDMAGAQLELAAGDRDLETRLEPGPQSVVFRTDGCPRGCPTTVVVRGAEHHAAGDTRVLTVRLEGAWAEGTDYAPAFARWSPGLPRSLRSHDVTLEGFEPAEQFRSRRGAWTGASATLSFPARPGTVRIHLARPAHTPGMVTLETDAQSQTLDVPPSVTTVDLRTDAPEGRTTVRLSSPTFVPADVSPHTQDPRALGLIVYTVEFFPDADPCRPDDVSSSQGGTR